MNDKPTGTVSFLFTDIEGSTQLWENHPQKMKLALKRHDEILTECLTPHGAYVFKTMGDAFHAAFSDAEAALKAALDAQEALEKEEWGLPTPIRVRMAIHSGKAELRDGDYYGQTLNRAARLLSSGHGGQTLISHATLELAINSLDSLIETKDMGEHRLKDLIRPERIYQINKKGTHIDFPPLNTLNNRNHNIPPQSTSFVGREEQLTQITRSFYPDDTNSANVRLITLLGTGGAGKTRLSLQWGADSIDRFADGVWFVDLSPAQNEECAFSTLTRVLGIEQKSNDPVSELIQKALKKRSMLIILDNCEHLILTAARIAECLLEAGKGIKIIATSREMLQIRGENIIPVPPLMLPDKNEEFSLPKFGQYEAVKLFIERARAVQPSFSVTSENAPDLADICQRVDGVPLAIELAAAKIQILPLDQIRERIKNPLKLLNSGFRTATPRQQTLRGLIDWSYDILEPDEKILFTRLSVFSSSFDMSAAEAVCGNDCDVLDVLSRLCSKSMVFREGDYRFRLLETLREYAKDKIGTEISIFEQKHFEYFSTLSAENHDLYYGDLFLNKKNKMQTEYENLKQALSWSIQNCPLEGLKMARDIAPAWWSLGNNVEGARWLELLLEIQKKLSERDLTLEADANCSLGVIYHQMLKLDDSEKVFTKALLYYQKLQLDDKAERKIAFAKRGLGLAQLINTFFLNTQDDHSKQIRDCKANFDDSLKLYTKLDDKWGIAEALAGQAMTSAIVDNNYHDALNLMSKSLQIRTDIRDYSGIGWAHFTIADYLQQLAQEENVIEHLEKAKEYFTLAGDRWGLANNGEFLGFCLMIEKRYDDAEAELSQSKMLHSMIGGINQADYAKLYSVMLLIERRDNEDIEEKLWKIINRAGAIGEEFIQIYGFGILLRYFQLEDQTLKVIATIDHFRTISAGMFTNQKNSFIGLAITYLLLAKNNYNQAVQFIAALSKRYPQMSHEKYNIASLEYKRLTAILKEKLGNNDFHDLTAIGESWSNQQFDDQLTETF